MARPKPETVRPTPNAHNPKSYTLHPTPRTLHPEPGTRNPEPYTLNPTPWTLDPEPWTLDPGPQTLHPGSGRPRGSEGRNASPLPLPRIEAFARGHMPSRLVEPCSKQGRTQHQRDNRSRAFGLQMNFLNNLHADTPYFRTEHNMWVSGR